VSVHTLQQLCTGHVVFLHWQSLLQQEQETGLLLTFDLTAIMSQLLYLVLLACIAMYVCIHLLTQ